MDGLVHIFSRWPELTRSSVVDILLVAILVYEFFLLIRGTRGTPMLIGVGALAVIFRERRKEVPSGWLGQLLRRRPIKVAAVALANKTARIVWAMLARGQTYHAAAAA